MKMDLDFQKEHRTYNKDGKQVIEHRTYSQVDPLFHKSLQRQAKIVENCEINQKPFFMENKLCKEKS